MSNILIKNKNRQTGFSLLEVMISLIVLAIGMLGLGGLQVAALKGSNNAHSRTIATMYAMELADRMRANPAGVSGGFYGSAISCPSDGKQCRKNTYCTPQEVATFDTQEVLCGTKKGSVRSNGIKQALFKGTLEIDCDTSCAAKQAIHNITITWSEVKSNAQSTSTGDGNTQTLVFPVIP